jgi:Holliday junction DNA helicase RuvA
MFTRIVGTLIERRDTVVLLDVAGLGYEIVLPGCVADKLPTAPGEKVTLEIHPTFNLEGNSGRFTFFGFTNAIEREFFEALVSVASIGPKTAARAFALPMARIAAAIDAGDHAFLLKLPGIGQQKARDIVAKLQGKVTKFMLIRDPLARPASAMPDYAEEAIAVLVQLEYKRPDAEAMVARAIEFAPAIKDAETLLAEVYRRLHAGATEVRT